MRFIENGPDIPDELLIARDEGNVLFFCGAGVSLAYAGLADFLKLAEKVIDELGSLTGSQARRLHDAASTKLPFGAKSFVPVDRMFTSLDLEFDPREVRDTVARALTPEDNVDLVAHRTLIDLSRGSDGRPRLVTTNFDLLFEACEPQMKSWGPSNLPVPERPADFEGIIHVHGRVDEGYTGISGAVVLSSGDFGRAYLSDGWATHYIRRLMNRFKIVFVGYSAEDPPVQYLLEALREEQSPVKNIYAFQYGEEAYAQEQWIQKGVVPLAFGDNYSNLWDTLKAWADRARDLDTWHQATIVAASSGPSEASPVFRGRIAHMASTATGMAKLGSGKPPLPATWLYAFDPQVRYLKPQPLKRYDFKSGHFDPFEHLGLDRDEPPSPVDPDNDHRDRQVPKSAWNAFVPSKRDLAGLAEIEVGSIFERSAMVPRLWTLAVFVINRMTEAPALWWAAGQRSVHPQFAQRLEQQLRYRLKDDEGKLPRYWRYLFALWKEPDRDADQEVIHIRERAEREGWSPSLVREAVGLSRPFIAIRRASGVAPPTAADADPADFTELNVEYPHPYQDVDFSDADLSFVVSLWRALLVEAEQMERDIGAWISLDTTRPDDGQKLGGDSYGLTGPLIRFTHLMEALEASDEEAARREVGVWETHSGLVFERLRIWAAGRPGLTSIEYAEHVFAALDDEKFWLSDHERDLLFGIRDRWAEMSAEARTSIEERLLRSSIPHFTAKEREEVRENTAMVRLNTLHWFAENGVSFSFNLETERARLLEAAPGWREDFADYTAQPRSSGVRSVTTDRDPASILDVPASTLLPIELPERRGRDFTERDPFAGYSRDRPARAVMALHSAMRRNVDTAWHYWSTFLRSTSETKTSQRLNSVAVALILKLSPEEIAKLWYPLVEWLSKRIAQFEARGIGEFDAIWDKVVEAASLKPSGYKQTPKRDWSFESLNSIAGRLVMALMDAGLSEGQNEIPAIWITRLTKVLELPGDHARHALYHVARQTIWFNHYQPAWMESYVLSKAVAAGPDADAFWSGFSRMARVPDPVLLKQLKPTMLARVGSGGRLEKNLLACLLSGWGSKEHDQIVTDAELRDLLILGSDEVRLGVLHSLGDWAAQNAKWREMLVPFVTKVWPKQRTLETPQMSSAFFRFASKFPDRFAEIVNIVSRRLVTLSAGHNLRLSCSITELDNEGVEALLTVFEKLLSDDRTEWPYEATRIINDLVTAGLGKGPRLDKLARRAAERT
ncbi:SIR2 family protein [Rhizobium ruizarguesonis]